MNDAFRQMGREAEVALKGAGGVPGGVSGEEFVRSLVEDMRRREHSPEWQARAAPFRAAMRQILEDVAAKVPGGVEDPQFLKEVEHRMQHWRENHPEPGEEAST